MFTVDILNFSRNLPLLEMNMLQFQLNATSRKSQKLYHEKRYLYNRENWFPQSLKNRR